MSVDQIEFNALREIVRENTGDQMMLLNRFTVRGMRHALGVEQESGLAADSERRHCRERGALRIRARDPACACA